MNVNDKAPDFTLQDENGQEFALKDLRGKTVVALFLPAPIPQAEPLKLAGSATHTKDAEDGRRVPRRLPRYQRKEISGKIRFALHPTSRCRQKVAEAFGVMKKEHVRQEGVGRCADHIRHRPRRRDPAYFRSEARGHAEEVLDYLNESAKGVA